MQHTRWMKVTFGDRHPRRPYDGGGFPYRLPRAVTAGRRRLSMSMRAPRSSDTDNYSEIDWTQPVEGRLEYHLAALSSQHCGHLDSQLDGCPAAHALIANVQFLPTPPEG